MLLLMFSPAQAAVVTQVDAPIILDKRAGTWARTFVDSTGQWWFFLGAGGGIVAPVDATFEFKEDDLIRLTDRQELQDHGIVQCPNGDYLHVGSYTQSNFNDSAHAYRYDADWKLIADAVLEEGVQGAQHNDMTVICSRDFQGVVFREDGGPGGQAGRWFGFDAQGTVSGPTTLENTPQVTGGAAIQVGDEMWLFGTQGYQQDPLQVKRYDAELAYLGEQASVTLSPDGGQPYWTQGLLKAGDYYLLAHMGRGQGTNFDADTGNVYLSVLDADLALLEQTRISDYSGGDAGMRPGLMRDGDTAVVSWDANLNPNLALLTLDLSGAGDLDSGWETGDTGSASSDGGGGGDGCGGCAGGGAGGIFGALLAAGLLGRRRS
ncbi:MAG: hypothetical protein ACI9VR_001424 [Cognaticolwellia sp.]